MNATITVDKAGRIVLPKPVREELELAAGDSLELESSGDAIILRPVRGSVGLRKKQGVWVLDVDEPISAETVNRTLREIREERERSFLAQTEAPSSVAGRKSRKGK